MLTTKSITSTESNTSPMLQRVLWFFMAHCLFFGITAALATASKAWAQTASAYDMRYILLDTVDLKSNPELTGAPIGQVAGGTDNVVLRWCRSEIPFGKWAYGSTATWRAILDDRVCEIRAGSTIGFVPGKVLKPVQ